MSDSIKICLPKLGESIVSATVVQWFKKVGDQVALDEPLLEVSTDKVNSEIPSPAAGVLQEIFVEVDQELQIGAILATISSKAAPKKEEFLSPSVSRLLQEKGLMNEMEKIPRTGQGGRLTKQDVEGYQKPAGDRVKMSSLRKVIAENMLKSTNEIPHATLITEVDVTQALQVIQEQKAAGVKLTITAFAAQGIVKAVQAFPLLNSSLEGDAIVKKRSVNIGIAVSVDQGVMVPVLKRCETQSVFELANGIAHLADKTRKNELVPDDTQEGTITLTNFGMTGVMIGIPIIRYPEVAIIGLGAITKKVVAMPDDSIAIRSTMMVSLTFDHRVLDGIYGCSFLNELKQQINSPVCHQMCRETPT